MTGFFEGLAIEAVASPFSHAAENLALEGLLAARGRSALFVHRDKPCVSVGFNQDFACEVDASLAMSLDVEAVRRRTGGGAVYRDDGCVAYSLVIPSDRKEGVFRAVLVALASLGVDAQRGGRNDLFWRGRKVSGVAWTQQGGLSIVHGSLLFSTDLGRMERLLGGGKAKYHGTAMASVRSRVANLSPLFPGLSPAAFQEAFEAALHAALRDEGAQVVRGVLDGALVGSARADAARWRIPLGGL